MPEEALRGNIQTLACSRAPEPRIFEHPVCIRNVLFCARAAKGPFGGGSGQLRGGPGEAPGWSWGVRGVADFGVVILSKNSNEAHGCDRLKRAKTAISLEASHKNTGWGGEFAVKV